MATVLKIPSLRVLLALLTLNTAVFVGYWIFRLRWISQDQFEYFDETKRKDYFHPVGVSHIVHNRSIQVLHTDYLPRLRHEDLFTEFDDVVLSGLYEEDEYIHDLRMDKHQAVDINGIANGSFSTAAVKPMTYYYVNDVLYVSIALHNGYYKRILRGGDDVRIWIKEPDRGACASGYVFDHHNGSYTGVVRLLWRGRVDVVVAIASSREAIRLLYTIHREGYLVRQMFAIFQRRHTYEMTLCAYTPHLPGYDNVCNLTAMNHGLPWYCGHPDFLTCAEWTRTGASQPPWPLYTDDRKLFDLNNVHQNFRRPIQVKVIEDPRPNGKRLVSCNELPPSATWSQATPVGYFLNWRWHSTVCTNILANTVESWNTCLSNRRLWMHGDSTLRQWFTYLQKRLTLRLTSEVWHYDQWPYPSTLYSQRYNYAVFWSTHELPFTNTEEFVLRHAHKAAHVYIDELPANNRDIVILHLYLHFTAYPPTLLQTHIQRIVQSVKALLARAPEAKVFVKGPHAFNDNKNNRGVIDDYWGKIYTQIYKKEFKDVQDQVYFLDFWDMTVAAENDDVHPNVTVYDAMIHSLLGYICH
ncbi:NXPE family member 2-like [Haliotis rubra]|uniref:NXPE family member 2-like n=1 Tax=Haliotis rubra TaxID=36100 RepID=UPI001EE519AF|nr:NXPE family member 2-like [Haliotis rubra]